MFGIIGGNSLPKLSRLEKVTQKIIRTPYGLPSTPVLFGRLGANEVAFIARHGYGHMILPHRVNYRANLWALSQVGVRQVVSVVSVGGFSHPYSPHQIVLPDQLIDYTRGRSDSLSDTTFAAQVFLDFTEPYSASMRQALESSAKKSQIDIINQGTYAVTQGPRLDTAAEVARYESDGANFVGMTGMPEAIIAKELSLEYAALCIVSNWAAGRGDSTEKVTPIFLQDSFGDLSDKIHLLLTNLDSNEFI